MNSEQARLRGVLQSVGESGNSNHGHASMIYFILFTQRSGSSHLCDLLTSIGLGQPGEYDLFENGTVDRLADAIETQGDIAGVKIDWETLKRLMKQPGDIVERFVPRLLYLRRKDRLAQAISWAKALQTEAWSCFDKTTRKPVYDRSQIAERLKVIDWQEARFADFLKGKPRLELFYEEPDDQKIVRICDDFAFSPAGEPKSYFRKQADETSDLWRAKWENGE